MEQYQKEKLVEKIENLMAKRFPTRKAMDAYVFTTTTDEFAISKRTRQKRPSMRICFSKIIGRSASFFKVRNT